MKKLIARAVVSALVAVCASSAFAQQSGCPFNVDNSPSGAGAADAFRDGTVLLRYALGRRNADLVTGTTLDAATVTNVIESNRTRLDVNGNGVFDTDDALIISRVLLGFAEADASKGIAAAEFRTRVTERAVSIYLQSGCAVAPLASLTDPAHVDASRFLTQATFGPSHRSLVAFKNLNPTGTHAQRVNAWLNAQYSLPRKSTHIDYTRQRQREVDQANVGIPFGSTITRFFNETIRESFFTAALGAEDQLRHRVAFALSQIMVVSSNGGSDDPYELANYLDMLADNAFGNFRALLVNMSLSNAMGRYLDHAGNEGSSATPNENFARELLQLFSLGLVQLNQDGTNVSANTPTYDEDTVKGFARVFTGFNHVDPFTAADGPDRYNTTHPRWNFIPDREADNWAPRDANNVVTGYAPEDKKQRSRDAWNQSMIAWAGRHSVAEKQLLKYTYPQGMARVGSVCARAANNPVDFAAGTAILPALTKTVSATTTQDANDSLNAAIDNIFCHPTLGPFISKSLIRFFVTSTPTTGYVSRVTAKFNDNGAGVRGDMRAVLTAIFTDAEALNPSTLSATDQRKFGKLKEPILRFTAALRAFDPVSMSDRARIQNVNSVEFALNQGPLQSPSVFNYFHPEFTPPGPVAMASAYGPEFEITTTTSIAATANFLGSAMWGGDSNGTTYLQAGYFAPIGCSPGSTPPQRNECLYSDLSPLYAVASDAGAIMDQVNLIMMQGKLSNAERANYVSAIDTAYPNVALPAPPAVPTSAQLRSFNDARRNRVKMALWLTVHSPEFQIQR